jgi:transposase
MSQLIGSNRNQLELFCLESCIEEDSIVRIIELIVAALPLKKLGFVIKDQSKEGRLAYSVDMLLKLYLYGYFNRVRSSRHLERETQTNLEAIWLMKGLRPCFRTIAGFRQENSEALEKSFAKSSFRYNEQNDTYICPAGQELTSTGTLYTRNKIKLHKAYKVKKYRLPVSVCRACEFYQNCLSEHERKAGKSRYVERSEYDDYIEDNKSRTMLNKETYGRRQQIIEHPFGTIKRQWGYDYTLMKGLKNVSGEWAIIFWVYNLRRCLTILGEKELRKRLREAADDFFSQIRTHIKLLSGLLSDQWTTGSSNFKQKTMRQIQAMSLSEVLIS